MLKYIVRRMLSLVVILLGVSIIVFMLVHLAPGDPVRIMLGEEAREEDVERLNRLYGFDRPLPVQYVIWLGNALRGDLGTGIRSQLPVTLLIFERMPATIELALWSLVLAVGVGIPLGVLSAVRRNSWIDFGSMFAALVGVAAPNFWVGLILLSQVALHVSWLPIGSRGPSFVDAIVAMVTQFDFMVLWDHFRYVLLPALALGTSIMALITRLTRSSLLEVLNRDYVRTARAKGLRGITVVYGHALKNALLPVVTVVGVQFGALLGGAIVIEVVFAWPGVGRLIVSAISQRDFPVVQGSVLMLAVVFAIANLLVDLSYSLINPRIRYD
ncbi:MAG: ABC transporter permease [Trueperaceae bacterium]|nr:MAG: ABC transporter permease [Trueperaceae bacterium]